jgi:hypothetical protein
VDGDDTWTTVVHPDTLTNGYSPVYTDSQDVRLTSAAPIPLPSGRALLSFASHEDIEDGFDYAYVEVSGDGGPFLPMAVYTGNFAGRRNVDLSFFAGQDVLIRFRFVTDELMSAPLFLGWFLDDIAIDSADFHCARHRGRLDALVRRRRGQGTVRGGELGLLPRRRAVRLAL